MAPSIDVLSTPRRQAWGSNAPKKYQLGLRRNEVLAKPKPEPEEVNDLLEKVQADVSRRRVRVKDNFYDFDPLKTGRCTPEQFVRAANLLAPQALPAEKAELLAEHFKEDTKAVNYRKFVQSLESNVASTPRPDSRLHTPRTPIGKQVWPGFESDEVLLEPLYRRMACS